MPQLGRAVAEGRNPQDFGDLERDLADATEAVSPADDKGCRAPAAVLSAQADQSHASARDSRSGKCWRPSFRSSSRASVATSRAPAIIDSTTDLGRRDGVFGSGADRQHQLGRGGSRRVFVIDDGKRQRAELACHLRGGDDIGTTPGLRHDDEQGVAHVRRPLVGGHDGRCGGGCEQAKPRFEQVAQIDAGMT